MSRLAWFTPTPPNRSGIAAYNEELLPVLAGRHEIDVFTSPAEPGWPRPVGHPPVFEGHDFTWKHFTAPYDLVVYQLGNAMCHNFMWPHLFRHPGLVVLHDAQLHHSRAWQLLAHGRGEEYRAEFRANHPEAPDDAAELIITGLAEAAYYFWPMLKLVVESSRRVAVHTPRLAKELGHQFGCEIDPIRMGVRDPRASTAAPTPGSDSGRSAQERRAQLRARYHIPADAIVFSAFGLVTPEKRISIILRSLKTVLDTRPEARLLLVGGTADHYDAVAEAAALGVGERVVVTGYVPDEEVAAHLEASDVCLCLRWPTGGETSASWLRALASGLPTVVTDLAHNDEMAFLDPRTWTVQPAASGDADPAPRAVCVGIDILDEAHSLTVAMLELARDGELRAHVGAAARAHWESHHTLACMTEDYERVLTRALAAPVLTSRGLPAHLTDDGTQLARRLLDEMGTGVDFLRRSPLPEPPLPAVE
jgi:glycosyltransferase involved in cell wall biosynthesis